MVTTQANLRIRQAAAERGIRLWMVAEQIKMKDSNFSRKLRHELPEEEQERILAIIDQLASARDNA